VARRTVDVRREEILRATVEQISASGFAETRVADVATALGISTALVFYHFESKDRLLSEAFSYAAESDLAQLARLAESHAPVLDRLKRMLSFYGPEGGQGWSLWIEAWAAALRMPELQKASRRLDVHWKNTVADLIREGVESGDFRCEDPNAAAWRITGVIDGLAVQATVHKGVVSRSTLIRWVRQVAATELDIDPALLA
jgi:AcrR family transcriptional regulator